MVISVWGWAGARTFQGVLYGRASQQQTGHRSELLELAYLRKTGGRRLSGLRVGRRG